MMVQIRGLGMRLASGGRPVTILDGVSFDVPAGQVVAIAGPSGSGKSTLLGLIAGLDRPTTGSIRVAGVEVTGLGEAALAHFRRDTIGYVFQSYHLIPTLTAAENVAVPLELAGAADALARALKLLEAVGLGDRGHHYPVQLSGGEQQRVALARAVALRPPLLLADEPTGNLDTTTGAQIIELMLSLNRERGSTLLLVTHDPALTVHAERVIAKRLFKIPEILAREFSALAKVRHVGAHVVHPHILCITLIRFAAGKEQHVGLHALGVEDAGRQAQQRMHVELLQQIAAHRLARATLEQHVVRHHHRRAAVDPEQRLDVLEKI